MKSPIKVLALVPYPLGQAPSQRYRIEQWQPYLEQERISLDLSPFATEGLMRVFYRQGHLPSKAWGLAAACIRRSLQLTELRRYDAVLIHRAACLAGPAVLERAIALSRKPFIFDFDDAIYLLHTTSANEPFGWMKFAGKTASICRASAHVVVGNSYLADYARQYNPQVTIIPSSVDTERYCPRGTETFNPSIVVGWMGSSTSQTHLEAFAPVMRELFTRPGVELRIISDREPILPSVPFVWRRWSPEREVHELAQFDIGIMPMPDDPWTRGKCAMKALLYMSMGVPVICSAVGTNREVIVHGSNGLLASTSEEWVAGLDRLVADPAERERLGVAGRHTVEERYSKEHCAARFARVIEQTIEKKRPATGYDLADPKVMSEEHSLSRN
ncbi:MAG TPA: glycosyltransferase family 4 protein [Blastocatellia bacterium]|nr:glycosyltransferase family 4 protein [Blastocatellia bacterium]